MVLEVAPLGSAFLVTINTTTGAVTNAGQTVDALDAIAFVVPSITSAPAMNKLGLILCVLFLLGLGIGSVSVGRARRIHR